MSNDFILYELSKHNGVFSNVILHQTSAVFDEDKGIVSNVMSRDIIINSN